MESSGATSSSVHNRGIGAVFRSAIHHARPPVEFQHKKAGAPEPAGQGSDGDVYVEDNSWIAVLVSWVRIVTCFMSLTVTTFVWAVIMLVLVPWPTARIKQGNIYGHLSGKMLMWILGNPIRMEGAEFSNTKAIYVCNHASPIDIFLLMWLAPTGTVGIAKKELIFYPLIGQLFYLANHQLIDRSNRAAAIQSMKKVAQSIVKDNLSLVMFPEGTRSRGGRLLPFKKGFVHVALDTRLPIVPIVLMGTHRAWRTGSLHVRPAPLVVKFLPPIKTDEWTADKVEEYVTMVHDLYATHLPESQRPLDHTCSKSQ